MKKVRDYNPLAASDEEWINNILVRDHFLEPTLGYDSRNNTERKTELMIFYALLIGFIIGVLIFLIQF